MLATIPGTTAGVADAEKEYRVIRARYGSLQDPESAGVLDESKAAREQRGAVGFSFELRYSNDNYRFRATAVNAARDPSFSVDSTGAIKTICPTDNEFCNGHQR